MTTTDAQVDAAALRTAGVPITALDGNEYRLIYDMDALARIEQDFGGTTDALNTALSNLGNPAETPVIGTIVKLLRAGLEHDRSATDVRFDVSRLVEYQEAIQKAAELNFPKEEEVPEEKPTDILAPYLGPPSTTPQPFAGDAVTSSSGV